MRPLRYQYELLEKPYSTSREGQGRSHFLLWLIPIATSLGSVHRTRALRREKMTRIQLYARRGEKNDSSARRKNLRNIRC